MKYENKTINLAEILNTFCVIDKTNRREVSHIQSAKNIKIIFYL